MIKNFLSSIVVSLFLILLVILCSENDKEESRHEPQNTWFYMPTQPANKKVKAKMKEL